MFHSLGKLLPASLKSKGALAKVHASVVITIAEKVLIDTFGEAVGGSMKIKTFRNGTLAIVCRSSVDSQEIAFREAELVTAINKRLGKNEIQRLRATG